MKYMGSKNRIAKHILPIMLKHRTLEMTWVEPFVGGANMIDKVDGKRIGNDYNKYIYALLVALRDGWQPPAEVSEEYYKEIKANRAEYDKCLVGYVGSQLTFGATWFGTYRRDKVGKRNYSDEAKRNVLKQAPRLKDVDFYNLNYQDLEIPPNSLIYCDPPYEGTFGYEKGKTFDHNIFWQWCRDKAKEGHTVFVSEYNAPDDFKCIWEKQLTQVINNTTNKTPKPVEKLFTLNGFGKTKERGLF